MEQLYQRAAFDNNPVFWADPSGANSVQDLIDEAWSNPGIKFSSNGDGTFSGSGVTIGKKQEEKSTSNSQPDSQPDLTQENRCDTCPAIIDLQAEDVNKTLINAIEWARYIIENQNIDLYLFDIVKINIYKKKRSFGLRVAEGLGAFVGGNTDVFRDVTIKGKDGASLTIFFDKGYYNHFNSYGNTDVTRLDGINFAADIINSNRHEINFYSQSESSSSKEPLLILQFHGPDNGKVFYDEVRLKMKEKQIDELKK